MGINEFAQKICKAVGKELGEGYRVELKQVRKNNGVVLHGLVILSGIQNVAPTIYLDAFLEAYEAGTSFAALIRRLLAIYGEDAPKDSIDMEFFRCYDKVQDRICYRLVSWKKNEELLRDVPHIAFLDLAICFYYAYQGDVLGQGMILVHNSHMEMWKASTAQLYEAAKRNTQRLYPWVCSTLEEVLDEIMESGKTEMPESGQEFPLKVLSNEKRIFGATCLLYPGVLDKLAERGLGCFFILPSSVHEVILLGEGSVEDAWELKKMIVEINGTQVAPEEVLSDSLYRYDPREGKVKIIF